ncbi:hypothetical protein [Aurantiacibacter sediminis]|uniref:Uncharacterized protein n=1 Tax=Aurantiacibacter sediminis TaxID=2793064 RepID=A0ABS0N1E9_9SPHN|nr:hypothetical protein [Aurantiacibacter sediminis]MBH5321115.1 hypothetical protein [Aurantiacibacter sediminis]
MNEPKEKRGDRRESGDRRKAQLPFDGPDRRKGGDRRSGEDRRATPRVYSC